MLDFVDFKNEFFENFPDNEQLRSLFIDLFETLEEVLKLYEELS